MDNRTDAYTPTEVFRRVEIAATSKAALTAYQTLALAVLGGAFIGIGALLYLQVIGDPAMGLGVVRLVGGMAFSLGLVMIVVGGAELFTGNMLVVMALADRRISARDVARNWSIVYIGNMLGAVGLVCLAAGSGLLAVDSPLVTPLGGIVAAKNGLGFVEAFCRGVLCNILVCMAVWLAMSGRTTLDRIVATMLPIAAFVALGLEHSIANMVFFPAAMVATGSTELGWIGGNLLPVTMGNMVGGGVLVGLVYRSIYGTMRM